MLPKSIAVSIVIPAFNAAQTIAKSIESCQRQTLENIEIIIVDDCSQDDTAGIVKELMQEDCRILMHSHAVNKGSLQARATAHLAATGEFILSLDSDDLLKPEAAEILLSLAYEKKADIVSMKFDTSMHSRKSWPYPTVELLASKEIFPHFFSAPIKTWSLCTKLIKRELLLSAHKSLGEITHPVVICEDLLIFFVAAHNAKMHVGTNRELYIYRESITSVDRAVGENAYGRRIDNISFVLQVISGYVDAKPDDKELQTALTHLITYFSELLYQNISIENGQYAARISILMKRLPVMMRIRLCLNGVVRSQLKGKVKKILAFGYDVMLKNIPSKNDPSSAVSRLRVSILRHFLAGCGSNVNIQPGVTIEGISNVSIGDNSGLGRNSYIRAGASVTIGDDVMIGPELHIYTGTHNKDRRVPMRLQGGYSKAVVIEDDVWIGARSTILQGVTVAKGCVIAAGAVVTKSTEPFGIYGGVPAKRIGERS